MVERAAAHFCPSVVIDEYLNVPSLLSKLLSKIGLLGYRGGLLLSDTIQHFIIARNLLKGYVKIGAWE